VSAAVGKEGGGGLGGLSVSRRGWGRVVLGVLLRVFAVGLPVVVPSEVSPVSTLKLNGVPLVVSPDMVAPGGTVDDAAPVSVKGVLSAAVGICGLVTLVTSLVIAQLHSPVLTSLVLWCRRAVVQLGRCLVHPRATCLGSVVACQ
jgi:hypothetical protein